MRCFCFHSILSFPHTSFFNCSIVLGVSHRHGRVIPLVNPRCESKNRVCPPLDLALPACHYDLRVSVMREEPLPVPTDYASSASGTRLKNRESVVAPPHHPDLGCWQLDLTEVWFFTLGPIHTLSRLVSLKSLRHISYLRLMLSFVVCH